MVISHSKKFIFVHIYKTAGTSITSLLAPHARLIEKISSYYPTRYGVGVINRVFGLGDYGNKWINGVHKHATAKEISEYLGGGYEDYFKFSFVRHPLDWQVSLYEYIKNTPHRDNEIANKLSFKDFALREIERGAKRQWDFLSDGGKIIVDYVGKLENIQKDLGIILDKIGLSEKRIPHLNASPRSRDWGNCYDSDLLEKIKNYYEKDFIEFGYEI